MLRAKEQFKRMLELGDEEVERDEWGQPVEEPKKYGEPKEDSTSNDNYSK